MKAVALLLRLIAHWSRYTKLVVYREPRDYFSAINEETDAAKNSVENEPPLSSAHVPGEPTGSSRLPR